MSMVRHCPEGFQAQADFLAGKTVLITGAGDGIGRELACQCAAFGAEVVLLGRTIAKLEAVYDQILDVGGAPEPAIYPFNLEGAAANDYLQLADTLAENFSRLDVLVHNAAMLGSLTPVALYDEELWHQVMQVNLNAAFMLSKACLPLLLDSEDSQLLFTTDSVGSRPKAYWGAYQVSKAGLEALARCLAVEHVQNDNLRVNLINPGPVGTHLRTVTHPGIKPSQWKSPADVMPMYLWALSERQALQSGDLVAAADA